MAFSYTLEGKKAMRKNQGVPEIPPAIKSRCDQKSLTNEAHSALLPHLFSVDGFLPLLVRRFLPACVNMIWERGMTETRTTLKIVTTNRTTPTSGRTDLPLPDGAQIRPKPRRSFNVLSEKQKSRNC